MIDARIVLVMLFFIAVGGMGAGATVVLLFPPADLCATK